MKSSIAIRLIQPIITGALIFYVFSGISSVLNYAFYPAIARFVSVSQYGEIQFLVSMFTQLAVGFVVLNILAIIIGAELKSATEQSKAMHSLTVVATVTTLLIAIVGAAILFTQKTALNLQNDVAIIALSLSLLINVPFTIAIGRLQGNNRFVASGLISMLGAFLKLVFSILFVVLGYGVAGAIFGIFAGMVVSLAIASSLSLHEKTPPKEPKGIVFSRQHLIQLNFIKNRAAVALAAITLLTLLSAADSITSRVALSGIEAGHYAAIATVAKMILAATSPLMWLALPPAIQGNNKVVLKYIIVTFLISIIAGTCFTLAPSFFTGTIIGVDPGPYIALLPLAVAGMTLCAVAFILLTVSICRGYLKGIIMTLALATVLYFFTYSSLSTATESVTASLYGQVVTSACLIIGLGIQSLHTRKASRTA